MSSKDDSIHALLSAVDLSAPAASSASVPLQPQQLFPTSEGETSGGVEAAPSSNINVDSYNNLLSVICFDEQNPPSSVCGGFVGTGDVTSRFCTKLCAGKATSCNVDKHRSPKFMIPINSIFISKGNTAFCQPTLDSSLLSPEDKEAILKLKMNANDWASYFMTFNRATVDSKVKMEDADKSLAALKHYPPWHS